MRIIRILLPIVLLSGCTEPPPPVVERIPQVKTFEVGESAQGQIRRISGKLIAADSSPLSFAVGGTVAEVNVSAGESVTLGQLLASLEKRPFELAIQNSRAQLTIARAKLNEKQQRYARLKELYERKVSSRSELDVAESELATARGNLQAAESTLESAERDLNNTVLAAPFSGRLATRSIEPFQEIASGKEAFVIESTGALQVEVLTPETLIRDVDYGQVVQVSFPTLPGTEVGGIVAEIGSQVQAGNAFPVKVRLATTNVDLRPGMSAAVTFNFDAYLKDRQVYLIPISAIAIDAGLLSRYEGKTEEDEQKVPVYVFDESSSTVKLRQVKVGDLRGNLLEVYEGLESGDRVVSAGVSFLRDNMKAALWDATEGLVK